MQFLDTFSLTQLYYLTSSCYIYYMNYYYLNHRYVILILRYEMIRGAASR